ncbi:vacuolar protein sorting-associated protein 13C [Elysia marginata]|uniref:Vacuolar protein sorting-associated protein 13C n=1 Tax=Elysia marginata TaxID=1093978 RepID=A0AAV4EIP8_9GAST|nr:vacuolar protein sorting-associated protein 13C [Elysia marginata]
MTARLGNIFSSNSSSDADVSDTEDEDDDENDDGIDMSLDKPVFLTSRGPVHVAAVDSSEKTQSFKKTGVSEKPKSGHKDLELVQEEPLVATRAADPLAAVAPVTQDPSPEKGEKKKEKAKKKKEKTQKKLKGSGGDQDMVDGVRSAGPGASAGLVDDGVGDRDDQCLYVMIDSMDKLQLNVTPHAVSVLKDVVQALTDPATSELHSVRSTPRFKVNNQVEGFEQTKTYLHKRARRTLVPLTPIKNGMQYCVLMEVDMWHARKSISFSSPLALENHLNLPVDLYCQTEDLKKFKATLHLAGSGKFSKLATVEPEETYFLPLFVAYHCPVYAKPSNIGYELTYNALWWKEMLQGKDKVKSFICLSTEEEKKSFYFKVVCKEGSPLKPAQPTPRALPYYTLSLHPPVILHNLLPYDVQFSLRGSLSEAVYEFSSSPSPLLFRFKKSKRKKAKLRVYESRWSQSFSTDTVGSGGVVVCHDKERGKKYMFMIQIALSNLQRTKIVTIVPFFLIINNSNQKLRYMEENEQADLWIDIEKDQYQPFWPVTESFNMYVKYDGSNVSSLHFPIKSCHNTVLRMDQGRALCVEVTGGTDTPITIIFTDYEPGDAPARVENLCEDVFIKIHQKNQSQATLLPPYQSILYTWDEPSAERTLMWNVYGRKRASYPAFISKDGSGEIRLQVPSLRSTNSAGLVVQDTAETDDSSSPEDESDEVDGLLDQSLLSRTRVDKMVIFWVSYLDSMQRVLLFTQDERVAKAVRKVRSKCVLVRFLFYIGVG